MGKKTQPMELKFFGELKLPKKAPPRMDNERQILYAQTPELGTNLANKPHQ